MSNFSTLKLLGDISPDPAKGRGDTPASGPVPAAAPASDAALPSVALPVENTASHLPVYAEFFGFTQSPFNLTPDPHFLFLTDRMREALSNVRYGISQARGLTVLLGDAGTGKTTLVRAAMDELPKATTRCVMMSNPALGREEFYEFLAGEFGFSHRAARSKTRFLAELEDDLRRRAAEGGVTGLIVDEAQSLSFEILEEIRLLGNIETSNRKLLNVVLSGQPELAVRLNDPSLRQLKQRVALRCELAPLSLNEAMAYIAGRIRIAGGAPEQMFTQEAVKAIHRASAGIPRSINVICDNALLSSFALQAKPVRAAVVADVCRDFDFVEPAAAPAPAPTPSSPAGPSQRHAVPPGPDTAEKKKFPFSFFS
jgi:general secretion pathway protein A